MSEKESVQKCENCHQFYINKTPFETTHFISLSFCSSECEEKFKDNY